METCNMKFEYAAGEIGDAIGLCKLYGAQG